MPSTKCPEIQNILKELQTAIPRFNSLRIQYLAAKENGEEKDKVAEAAELVDIERGKIKKLIRDASFYIQFEGKNVIYRTITIGGKTPEELVKELDDKKISVDNGIKNMIQNKEEFKTSTHLEKLELVILSVADMGFSQGATTKEIYDKAKQLGLVTVPAEASPHFRLQYMDQPMDEYLFMGMDPITDSYGRPSLFHVYHNNDGRYLDSSHRGDPDDQWGSSGWFVFARGK